MLGAAAFVLMLGTAVACDSHADDSPATSATDTMAVTTSTTTAATTITAAPTSTAMSTMIADVALTLADLEEAIVSAIAKMQDAPGIDGIQLGHIKDHLAAAVWFTTRPAGDFVVYQRVDQDVRESGFWMQDDGQPPATGRRIETTAWVSVADNLYEARMVNAELVDAWSGSIIPSGLPLSVAQTILTGQIPGSGYPGQVVSHKPGGNGGATWTLTTPYLEGESIQRWNIGPTGLLISYTMNLVDVALPPETLDPSTSVRVDFKLNDNPLQITTPELGTALTSTAFDLPADFPLGG